MSFYSVCYKIFVNFFRGVYNIKVIGAENEPQSGGVIAACNHISNSDVIIMAAAMKRQVRYMSKAELFKIPGLKQLITALGAFPVDRGGNDVGAIKKTIAILNGGEMVGLYPQGTRFTGVDPRETKPKNGVGMIALRSGATVLPVSIVTKGNKIKLFKKNYVVIGKPIDVSSIDIPEDAKDKYSLISEYIFEQICKPFEDVDSILSAGDKK